MLVAGLAGAGRESGRSVGRSSDRNTRRSPSLRSIVAVLVRLAASRVSREGRPRLCRCCNGAFAKLDPSSSHSDCVPGGQPKCPFVGDDDHRGACGRPRRPGAAALASRGIRWDYSGDRSHNGWRGCGVGVGTLGKAGRRRLIRSADTARWARVRSISSKTSDHRRAVKRPNRCLSALGLPDDRA